MCAAKRVVVMLKESIREMVADLTAPRLIWQAADNEQEVV
jgi:hypothetical protein